MNTKTVAVIMTYNCAHLIERAVAEMPKHLFDAILCADDGSTDGTVVVARGLGLDVRSHPHMGYGGNLRYGMQQALLMGASEIVEVHGDGQFDYSAIPSVIARLHEGCDIVLGNRFYDLRQPLKDGMSLVRYFGNLTLSYIGRFGMGIAPRDLFTGTRGYSRRLIESLNFSASNAGYFFSFEIIAQARDRRLRFGEIQTRCDYRGAHTSMKLWKGIPEAFQTCGVVVRYWLAQLGVRTGIFSR